MKIIELTPNTTINWEKDFNVKALYINDMTFSKINEIEDDEELVMLIDVTFYETRSIKNVNENDIVKEYKNNFFNYPSGILFALYGYNDVLVGFVRKKATWE